MSHVRYPADLFKVQRQILGQYHVTDAGPFYSRSDAWATPADPQATANDTTLQPPYYLTMQMPGQDAPAFSLYSSFIPRGTSDSSRSILTGYLAADADAGAEKGVKGDDYGKLRLLTLPKEDTVPGPGQVQNNFNSDPSVSSAINLLKQGQTKVINGNLLTVPVGGGLLYVQPVYVQSTSGTSYPLLRKILVAFGDQLAFEDTLDLALDSLFGGDSGASTGDEDTPTVPEDPADPADPDAETPDTSGNTALQAALADAKEALDARTAAYAANDLVAAAEADKDLTDALTRALAASEASE